MTGEDIKNIKIKFNRMEIDRYYTSKSSSFYFQRDFIKYHHKNGFFTGEVEIRTINYTFILNTI